MINLPIGHGAFPDIAIEASGSALVIYREGDPRHAGRIVVKRFPDNAEVWATAVPPGSPAFPLIEIVDGQTWLAWHDGTHGHLYNLGTERILTLNPCDNNWPFCFGEGSFAWQGSARDLWPIMVMNLRTGVRWPMGRGQGSGLAYIDPLRVVTMDENRSTEMPFIVNPVRSGTLVVGENPDDEGTRGVRWRNGQERGTLWREHVALNGRCDARGSVIGIVSGGGGGDVRVFLGSLHELRALSVEPPPPPPDPEPEKKNMELPRDIRDTYEKVCEKFPALLQSKSDDDRRVLNRRAVATIRRRHRGTGELDGLRYVCKNEHRGAWDVDSKDSQGYVDRRVDASDHGREMDMHMFDMVDGTKRVVHPHPIKSHNRTDNPPNLTAYVLIPEGEDDKDWLEEDGPVDPPPPDPGDTDTPIGRDVKHKWWRGDDEPRQDCNRNMTDGGDCDRFPDDPIHDVAEPEPEPEPELPKHAFKGLLTKCTFPKCGRAKTDPIHTTVTPDPKPTPTGDYEKKSLENQAEIIRLLKLAVGEP
jgi:hypothetical protein